MPRACAILAIACSAGALDVGLVAPNAFSCGRSKQLGALKHKWRTRLRVGCEQAELESWMGIDESLDCFPENDACSKLVSEGSDSKNADESSDESSEVDFVLPEVLVMAVMAYAGVQGRQACRSTRKHCDASLHDSLQLPEFPVTVRIKQHFQFGTEQSATSTWSLEVPTASSNGAMELRTEVFSEGEVDTSSEKSMHSNSQMINLWQQLSMMRSDVGVRHKESGGTQVEIEVIDAANRVFLDHGYKRRAFYNKADEILEIISETDFVEPAAFVESKVENRIVRSRHSRSRSANRPVSI